MIKIFKNKNGFTLVEMLIAVSLFIVIVTISIGAILTIFDSNRRAQASKTVVDNLNLAVENMARSVRFGGDYRCDGLISNCSGGDLLTVNFKGVDISYRLLNGAIQKKEGVGNYENMTSSETVIQYLKFYVYGLNNGDNKQPYVVVVIKGYSGNKPTTQSMFSLETVMSQRTLDI